LIPEWLQALLSGLLAGGALLVGAVIAWFLRVPLSAVAAIMAFGSGVLISALAFELVEDANERGGLVPTLGGFLAGSVIYVIADALLARRGAKGRQRADRQPAEEGASNSGLAIAVGAVVDGIPESVVLGVSLATGGGLNLAIFAAVAISNIPEGLSSTSGLKSEGRSLGWVSGMWSGIALVCGLSSLLGYALLRNAPDEPIAFVTAIAAGGILAMLANTMIPEAFARERVLTGLFATVGFLTAFALHELT
jgi:ZIP family zinc transporter